MAKLTFGHNFSDAAIKAEFQTNVFGGLSLTQSLLPAFRAQKSGHILNISSTSAFVQWPGFAAYSAAKAALEAFSETLSKELAPFGVRVLIVEPGYFHTNMTNVTAAHEPLPDRMLSGVYSQGARGPARAQLIVSGAIERGIVGDPMKAAERMFEVVTGTGLAAGLVEGQPGFKREWLRVPLGPDCGEMLLRKFDTSRRSLGNINPSDIEQADV